MRKDLAVRVERRSRGRRERRKSTMRTLTTVVCAVVTVFAASLHGDELRNVKVGQGEFVPMDSVVLPGVKLMYD